MLKFFTQFCEISFVWEVDLVHGFNEIWFNTFGFISIPVSTLFEIPELSDKAILFVDLFEVIVEFFLFFIMASFQENLFVLCVWTSILYLHVGTSGVLEVICLEVMPSGS